MRRQKIGGEDLHMAWATIHYWCTDAGSTGCSSLRTLGDGSTRAHESTRRWQLETEEHMRMAGDLAAARFKFQFYG